jgi:gluconokinase
LYQPFINSENAVGSADLVIVLMGVTGSGKTTVGRLLAARLGWEFADADQFHSPANVKKMAQGIVLTDADREPWLAVLRQAIVRWLAEDKNAVLACSALKRSYRDNLGVGGEVRLVYLKGSYDLIASRLRERHGHFATEAILADQFANLEEPQESVTVNIQPSPLEIVSEIQRKLGGL